MQKFINNPILNLVIRVFIGVIFIYFGASKLADPGLFAEEIGNYDMMPNSITHLLAIIFPWIEIVVGIMLLFGIKQKENAFIATSLLVVFTIAVAVAFARGLDISCGCAGADAQQTVGWGKIFENLGLIILTLYLLISDNKKFNFTKN